MQGRGKKDAKQVSAAAVLEMLLVNVPESDFLMPGKAKQTKTVQPTMRSLGRQTDYGRGRGRSRPSSGRYMSQRNTADYGDGQLIPSYNEAPYNYSVDNFSTPEGGYSTVNANFNTINPAPQAYNLPQQQQQQQHSFGLNLGGAMNSGFSVSGPLGHVGDTRGMPAPFQQVGCCYLVVCPWHDFLVVTLPSFVVFSGLMQNKPHGPTACAFSDKMQYMRSASFLYIASPD